MSVVEKRKTGEHLAAKVVSETGDNTDIKGVLDGLSSIWVMDKNDVSYWLFKQNYGTLEF